MRYLFIGILTIFSVSSLFGQQDNWRKQVKIAEEFEQKAQYNKAAEHFRYAWVLKPNKRDLIYRAGENFSIIKDYYNAAEAYRAVVGRKKFPTAGFKYALALKQQGKYEEASRAFANFIENYRGKDKTEWAKRVEMEILGCELAQSLPQYSENPKAIIQHPGISVNSPATDFAPIPVSETLLYFSSTRSGRAQIYRTEESGNAWTSANLPSNFPSISADHYCNGTLTPDNKRFYFTICRSVESWGGLTTRCEIYVTQRQNNEWAAPQRLDDYINDPRATTTHPHVVHNGDTEILYFSSNRSGGEGGMDIWYATRNVNGTDIDFTMPVNLGQEINTDRDEITPFYTLEDAILYFSSNGHPSIGGYDIYKSSGSHNQWDRPENLGYPFNSSADDYYYVMKPSRSGGFLVSNRKTDSKPETTHEDIFTFLLPNAERAQLRILGTVHNLESGELLEEVTISLYEQSSPGTKLLVDNFFFRDGNFELKVPRNARFLLEFNSPGFYPYTQVLNATNYPMQDEFSLPVQLEREIEAPTVVEPDPETPVETPMPTPTEADTPEQQEEEEEEPVPYTTRGQSPTDNYELITAAPRKDGTYFKVQLIAVVRYSEDHARYQPVKELGRLDTEYIIERELYRVLLADYGSLEEAEEVLALVQQRGFEGAYIVEYQDGERIGRIR